MIRRDCDVNMFYAIKIGVRLGTTLLPWGRVSRVAGRPNFSSWASPNWTHAANSTPAPGRGESGSWWSGRHIRPLYSRPGPRGALEWSCLRLDRCALPRRSPSSPRLRVVLGVPVGRLAPAGADLDAPGLPLVRPGTSREAAPVQVYLDDPGRPTGNNVALLQQCCP